MAGTGMAVLLFFLPQGAAGESRPIPLESPDVFTQAEFYYHSGDLLEAKRLYQEFLGLYDAGSKVERALFRLGQIEQKNKSDATALEFYKMLLNKFPDKPTISPISHFLNASYNPSAKSFLRK